MDVGGKASAHILPTERGRRAEGRESNMRASVQQTFHWGDGSGGGARVRAAAARTSCRPNEGGEPRGESRTRARQFNGHSMGAMDRVRGEFEVPNTHALPSTERQIIEGRESNTRVRHSIGAMDEGSGKVHKASAHIDGGVGVDVAAVKGHRAAKDVRTSALWRWAGTVIHGGDGWRGAGGGERAH